MEDFVFSIIGVGAGAKQLLVLLGDSTENLYSLEGKAP